MEIFSPSPAPASLPPPDVNNAAFKDWSLVCEALGRGRQSVILRKGGLAEGRGGFAFRHERFWLFPTRYHEQAAKIRPEELAALPPAVPEAGEGSGVIEVRYLFQVEWARRIEDWEMVARLAPFHILREEVARERFAYADRQHHAGAVSVAFGRTFRLEPDPWRFPDGPAFGGCRSWVELPGPPPQLRLTPVLSDREHRARALAVELALGGPPGEGDNSPGARAVALGGMGNDR